MKSLHGLTFAVALGLALPLPAADYTAGTVKELVDALNRISDGSSEDVLTLAVGVYDVSALAKMHTAAMLSVSNWVGGRPVIIQGDPSAGREDVVIDAGQSGRVLRAYNMTDGRLTFRNLTFRNGLSDGENGGVQTEGWGTFVFTNCAFVGCQAVTRAAAAGGTGDRYFHDCLFESNLLGGPWGEGGVLSDPKGVSGCTFRRNGVFGDLVEGAVLKASCGLTNCVFDSNANTGRWWRAGLVCLTGGDAVSCTFTNNELNDSCQEPGGILTLTNSASSVVDCSFIDNRGDSPRVAGGAIACSAADSSGEIRGCSFVGNDLSAYGACGAAIAGFSGLVTNCTFIGNQACYGGAVADCTNVVDCVFRANHAANIDALLGGGAALRSVLVDCTVVSNTALKQVGGICESRAVRCLFLDNGVTDDRGYHIVESMDSSFEACELRGNSSYGICHKNGSFSHCTFAGNRADGNGDYGYLLDGRIAVTNCLFIDTAATRLFSNYLSDAPNAVIGCTFVSNRYDVLATPEGDSTTATLRLVNNLFVGNGTRTWSYDDDVAQGFVGLTFSNNFLSTSVELAGANNINVHVEPNKGLNPRLMGARDPACPWAPRWRSPLNGAGLVMDWMADATDLDGHPRLTDGAVAIGAFETAEVRPGGLVIVR